LKRVGRHLGIAFANIHTLMNPDIILLGGGMMALKEFFIPEMHLAVGQHILPVANRENLFAEARFQNDAVMIGGSAIFA